MNVTALHNGIQPQGHDQLKKTTQEFEGMFLSYLLKVMRSTVETADDGEFSMGKNIYMEMFDNEIALSIARTRSLGIGEMIYRQLTENGVKVEAEPLREEVRLEVPIPAVPQSSPGISLPVDGRLSSGYGPRIDPITGDSRFHKGVDIAAPEGTPFRAVSDGTVVFAGVLRGYGNTVVIEHNDGTRTLYGHASRLVVQAGDVVRAEQLIGLVGKTGRATGPHLHFEAVAGGEPQDPGLVLSKNLRKVSDPMHR